MKELDARRYIIENINQNYNGYVNTKLSYNSNRYGISLLLFNGNS